MHAWDDAFVFLRGRRIRAREPRIEDLNPTVLASRRAGRRASRRESIV